MIAVLAALCVLQDGSEQEQIARTLTEIAAGQKVTLPTSPTTALGRAVRVMGENVRSKLWKAVPEDRANLSSYVRRILGKTDDEGAFRFLADRLQARKDRRLILTRTLALAHLECARLDWATIRSRADVLGLYEDDDLGWITREGRMIEKLRGLVDSGGFDEIDKAYRSGSSGFDPGVRYLRAVVLLVAAFRLEGPDKADGLQKALRAFKTFPAKGSDAKKTASRFAKALKGVKYCRHCKGSAKLPCDFGPCSNGTVLKKCAMCAGSGKNPQSYHNPNFQTPCPAKTPSGKHSWSEPCPRCKGAGHNPCKSCKEPWRDPSQGDILVRSGCDRCSGSGWILPNVRLACPECCGLGSVVKPAR
jgi:hypothetical protein